jgi:3'(2'), 5'-bisphosphate nucleotidase
MTSALNGAAELGVVIDIARSAGDEVLDVYRNDSVVEYKDDGSPLTEADRRAQAVICAGLEGLAPAIPIVAEEEGRSAHDGPLPARFWLVDPLDGTKEFISRNDEFTINIALIENQSPVLGVVYAPALDALYAANAEGAWLLDPGGRRPLAVRPTPPEGATVVSSRSHGDPDALAQFVSGQTVAASICAGSSLKFCLIAAAQADAYPRFGRTMEWDTAAGDAVVRAAGGSVTDLEGRPLRYGKPGFENPHFVARGRAGPARQGKLDQ